MEKNGWGYIVVFDPRDRYNQIVAPLDHELLFTLLASTDFAQLGPQLIGFADEDGSRLRSKLRERAKVMLKTGRTSPKRSNQLENFVGGSVLAAMQAADLMVEAGDGAAAVALLRAKRAAISPAALKDRDSQFEWVALAMREAKQLKTLRDPAGAGAVYRAILDNSAIDADYRINGAINYAAMLAELGQAKESLALLNKAEADFENATNGENVPGSDRQFAWIRACALHVLGDKIGTSKAIAVIEAAPEELRNANGWIAPTTGIEVRLAFCMKDDEQLAAVFTNPNFMIEPAAYALQRELMWFPSDRNKTIDRLRERLAKAGHVPRMRQMPAALVPAMNQWQVP